jgi:hypothetical protein
MREAQVEYPNPEIKKNIAAPILNCFGLRVMTDGSFTKFIKHLKYGLEAKSRKQKGESEKEKHLSFSLSAFCFQLTSPLPLHEKYLVLVAALGVHYQQLAQGLASFAK